MDEWIKKVIYIPKPGRAKNSLKGYKSLLMCETLYTIIVKTATHSINLISIESVFLFLEHITLSRWH